MKNFRNGVSFLFASAMQLAFGWIPALAYVILRRSPWMREVVARFNGGWTYAQQLPLHSIGTHSREAGIQWKEGPLHSLEWVNGHKSCPPTHPFTNRGGWQSAAVLRLQITRAPFSPPSTPVPAVAGLLVLNSRGRYLTRRFDGASSEVLVILRRGHESFFVGQLLPDGVSDFESLRFTTELVTMGLYDDLVQDYPNAKAL